jgi:hypothetical protein
MTVRVVTLDRGDIDHELIWGWVGLTCLIGLALFTASVRHSEALEWVCPFHALTGLPCLTCGATRAVEALVRGDAKASLRLHPLVVPGIAAATIYVPYALAAAHLGVPRLRVRLDDDDWRRARVVCAVGAAALWTFLIADGR